MAMIQINPTQRAVGVHRGASAPRPAVRPLQHQRGGPLHAFAARRKASSASQTPEDFGDDVEAKARALEIALRHINAKFGKGAIMKLGDQHVTQETTPTGSLTLDVALGGGYPKGRIIEIFGPESSGKTTLALHAIAEVQKTGKTAVFVDAEHAFDPNYAERLGVNRQELLLVQPDWGEQALQIVDELIASRCVDIICVDSVSALVPKTEIDGEIGSLQVGAQARLMSNALRQLASKASKAKCTIIFLNQLRYKVGVIYGNPETTSGGQALKFYSSVRLDIRQKEKIEGADKTQVIGAKTKVKVVKNKCFPPGRVAEFDVIYGEGIHAMGCVFDAAEITGVIKRSGSWYYHGENKLAQGREKSMAALTNNPDLMQQVEAETRAALKDQFPQDGRDGDDDADDTLDDSSTLDETV